MSLQDIKDHRQYVKDRFIYTNGDAKDVREVINWGVVAPLEKMTGADNPWRDGRVETFRFITGVFSLIAAIGLLSAAPLLGTAAFAVWIVYFCHLLLRLYGWTGNQFQRRLREGSTTVLWGRGGTKPANIVSMVARYREGLSKLGESARRSGPGSTLPDAYREASIEGETYLKQIGAVLDNIIDSRVDAQTSTTTLLMQILTELQKRIDQIDELLASEAHRKIQVAVQPDAENSLDDWIATINGQVTSTIALGGGEPEAPSPSKFDRGSRVLCGDPVKWDDQIERHFEKQFDREIEQRKSHFEKHRSEMKSARGAYA